MCVTAALPVALVGGTDALLAAVVLQRSLRARVLVFEPPEGSGRGAPERVALLPPRTLALLAHAAPHAAAALQQRGTPVSGGALCVARAPLRRTLLASLPEGAHAAGMRLTGFAQMADAGVRARFEGRAGRRVQRQLDCAALLGAGGARCAVRAALMGATPAAAALWSGVSSHVAPAADGTRLLALDDAGRCVGSALVAGGVTHWSMQGPLPRAAADAAPMLLQLASLAARWPLLATAILTTPPIVVAHEPRTAGAALTVAARGRVLLLGEAACGVASAGMDSADAVMHDAASLASALNTHNGDVVAAAAAFAAPGV